MPSPHDVKSALGQALAGLFLPEVSSLADLEVHLHLPREVIAEELASGRLRGLKLADQWLVHRDAVKAWLNVFGAGK